MKKYLLLALLLVPTFIYSRQIKVQKPVIFLSHVEESKYEIPVSFKLLKKINRYTENFLDTLKPKQRKDLVQYAMRFKNTKGKATKRYRNDCSGFTRRVYGKFNVELFKLPRHELRYPDGRWVNGVELIWKYAKKHGRVFLRSLPKPGDLVFFDNTHDRNKNKKYDDIFTHIGIVVKVDKDGTVTYIHKSNRGVVISKLNSRMESKYKHKKKEVNSFLRNKGKYRLGGQLLRGYGSIFNDMPQNNLLAFQSTPKATKKKATPKKTTQKSPKATSTYQAKPTAKSKSKYVAKKTKTQKNKHKKTVEYTRQTKKTKYNVKRKVKSYQKKTVKKYTPQKKTYPKKSYTKKTYAQKAKPRKSKRTKTQSQVEVIPSSKRSQVVRIAKAYLGKRMKKQDFAKKVFARAGYNILDREFSNERHEERKIFWSIQKNGILFSARQPKKADLIFFDKINGKRLFLNIGIIEHVAQDQVTFLYVKDGRVKRGYMNKKAWKTHKKGKQVLNSYLVDNKHSRRQLASQFFRRYGSLFSH